MNENSVIFKGRRDGLIIALDKDVGFDEIKAVLEHKLVHAKKFFDSEAAIHFRGRDLSEQEEDELISVITHTSGLSVQYVKSLGERVLTVEDTGKAEKNAGKSTGKNAKKNEPASSDKTTVFHKGALRSGQIINADNSVIIVGDLNPGAEAFAAGNIIVLGALKGLAHAGCNGNEEAFIYAGFMQPSQLRIADRITYLPAELVSRKAQSKPLFAYIKDERICIAPL